MTITRIWADAAGESHFEDVVVAVDAAGLSESTEVQSLIFRVSEPDPYGTWHTAPRRQYVVLLDGAVEVEVSDGERRTFGAGDILLAEDTFGTGHCTRTTCGGTRRSLFIPLQDCG